MRTISLVLALVLFPLPVTADTFSVEITEVYSLGFEECGGEGHCLQIQIEEEEHWTWWPWYTLFVLSSVAAIATTGLILELRQ